MTRDPDLSAIHSTPKSVHRDAETIDSALPGGGRAKNSIESDIVNVVGTALITPVHRVRVESGHGGFPLSDNRARIPRDYYRPAEVGDQFDSHLDGFRADKKRAMTYAGLYYRDGEPDRSGPRDQLSSATGEEKLMNKAFGVFTSGLLLLLAVASLHLGTAGDSGDQMLKAAATGDVERVKVLLASGVDINYRKTDGTTALTLACLRGSLETVTLLLERGADPNARDQDEMTPLMWACSAGNVDIVQLLLEKGSETRAKDKTGRTASSLALQKGHHKIVAVLDRHGSRPQPVAIQPPAKASEEQGRKLLLAAVNGRAAELKALIEQGASIDVKDEESGGTALIWASFKGHVEAVRILLNGNADVEAKSQAGWTPLLAACSQGHPEVVRLLLEKGANPDAKSEEGMTALSIVQTSGNQEILAFLIKHLSDSLWAETTVKKADKREKHMKVREGPSSSYKEVTRLKPGEKLKLNGFWSDGGWVQIFQPVRGWVCAAQIDTSALPSDKRAVFSIGKGSTGSAGPAPSYDVTDYMDDPPEPAPQGVGFLPSQPER